MFTFTIVCLLLGFSTLNAKSVYNPPLTLYDAITKNCANLNLNDTSFKNQTVFQKCKNWRDINETNILQANTEANVLCLLYYDSFISFCTDLKPSETSTAMRHLVPDIKNFQIKICEKLALFPENKKLEHDVDKIINDDRICYKLCLNYDQTLVTECGLAYHFLHFNISELNQELAPSTKSLVKNSEPISLGKHQEPSPLHETSQIEKKHDKPTNEPQGSQVGFDQNPVKTSVLSNVIVESKSSSKPISNSASAKSDSQLTPNKLDFITTNQKITNGNAADVNVAANVNQSNVNTLNANQKESSTNGKADDGISEKNIETISEEDNDNKFHTTDDEEPNDGNFIDKEEAEKPEDGDVEKKKGKPITSASADELPANYNTAEDLDGESYFFSYFMVICVLFVLGYVGYHNRQKVMALVLEGKRGKRQARGRRPNSANYHKLDSNLEEAISSTCTKNSSHVIY